MMQALDFFGVIMLEDMLDSFHGVESSNLQLDFPISRLGLLIC